MSDNQTVEVSRIVKTVTHFKKVTPKGDKSITVNVEYDLEGLTAGEIAELVGAQLDIMFCRYHNKVTPDETIKSWEGLTRRVNVQSFLSDYDEDFPGRKTGKLSPEEKLRRALKALGIQVSTADVAKLASDAEGLKQAFGLGEQP